MRQILDLHIHSKYSRACSSQLTLENIDRACRTKGVDVIATGDFTFPDWFFDIKNQLEETKQGSGLYRLKKALDDKIKFLLSTEVALIYKSGGKVRRIHVVLHAPNIKAVEELNNFLDKKYNIRSDGRPILGMSAVELAQLCFSINPDFLIYPAHIWTPWFAVFGSKSGFDSMEECFGEYTNSIYAIETGLSSDPEMNWQLSALDNLTILSNSDAHSLQNIGREANVFDLEKVNYSEISQAIKDKDLNKIKQTIEFYPEEGMYHYDGHLDCGIRFSPVETKKHHGICPVCKKPLTIGVLHRVEELADRSFGARPEKAADFKKIIELDKIIAEAIGVKSRNSKKVADEYQRLVNAAGSELSILLDFNLEKLTGLTLPSIIEGIRRVRDGYLTIEPGFDGQYGLIKIFKDEEKISSRQNSLF